MKSTSENLQVLYEDNHIIAINKRVGDIVQGDKTGDEPLSNIVKAYLIKKYQKQGDAFLGVVHRLDRPTTGVVVFAKTSKALTRLNALFAHKTNVEKIYWAIVEKKNICSKDTLTHFLVRNQQKNKSVAHINEVKNSKKAELMYEVLKQYDRYLLLQIQLFSGRHHQIRAQLSAIGLYIKGDLKYGAKRGNPNGGICLHARSVSFQHPVKQEILKIEAPLPNDFLLG